MRYFHFETNPQNIVERNFYIVTDSRLPDPLWIQNMHVLWKWAALVFLKPGIVVISLLAKLQILPLKSLLFVNIMNIHMDDVDWILSVTFF